jgi:CRP/FNR family cyclic AMP-dependent transcriptional regulator
MFKKWTGRDDKLCETMQVLHKVPLFSTLSLRQLKRLEPLLHVRNYQAGEVIFDQADEGLGMYVVVTGRVRICIRHENEKEKELAVLESGQFFGELALLDGAPRTATAVAVEPSKLVGFFRPEFLEILESHRQTGTKISLQLARLTGARLRKTLEGEAACSAS